MPSPRKASASPKSPAKGWKDVLWRLYAQFSEDRVFAVAAGVAFYMLLALFPALAALVSLYGLFTDPSVIVEHLSLLDKVVPKDVIDIVQRRVTRLTETDHSALSFGFFFSIAFFLWSSNNGMQAIIDALNVVYGERERRGFLKLILIAFAFSIGSLVFIALALAAVVVLPLVFAWFGFQWESAGLIDALRWPALLVIVTVWLGVLYRYGPSRKRPRWHWLDIGSIVATILWLGGSALFSWYLSNVAHYDVTYGSLGAVVGLMMWLWLSAIVVLVGAEINVDLEQRNRASGRKAS